jgi:hypothetical protein
MDTSKFSINDIILLVQSFYQGEEPTTICEELNIDIVTFNQWIRTYGQVADSLLQLKEENDKLRQMFVNLSLTNQSLREALDNLTASDASAVIHKLKVKRN